MVTVGVTVVVIGVVTVVVTVVGAVMVYVHTHLNEHERGVEEVGHFVGQELEYKVLGLGRDLHQARSRGSSGSCRHSAG